MSTFGPPPRRLRQVKKRLSAIAADDALLIRENCGERLDAWEVQEALEERGMYVPFLRSVMFVLFTTIIISVTDGLAIETMRARLQWWLAGVQVDSDPIRRRVQLIAASVVGKHE